MKKPVAAIYHDVRSTRKGTDLSPVKIRITFPVYKGSKTTWLARYVGTKIFLSPAEFATMDKAKTAALRSAREKINLAMARVVGILDENPGISAARFFEIIERGPRPADGQLVADVFKARIAAALQSDDVGNANAMRDASASILKFAGDSLTFQEITPEWLAKYEQWMIERKRSVTTIGFYLRALRAAYNDAIDRKIISRDEYPFGVDKYVIRKKRTKKRAIPEAARDSLLTYSPATEAEARALDYALFSYYAHGMNFTDMANLTADNFRSDHIVFIRQKTRKTVQEQREIRVHLSDEIKDIIARRGQNKPYVFGIITPDMDAVTRKNKIKQWIKTTNKWLNVIATHIGIQDRVTTYSMRHTFVTALINAGYPITKVADTLGHTSIVTTQSYAEDLDLATAKNFVDVLRPAIKKKGSI